MSALDETKKKQCIFVLFLISKFNHFLVYYDLSSIVKNMSALDEKTKKHDFFINFKSFLHQNLITF